MFSQKIAEILHGRGIKSMLNYVWIVWFLLFWFSVLHLEAKASPMRWAGKQPTTKLHPSLDIFSWETHKAIQFFLIILFITLKNLPAAQIGKLAGNYPWSPVVMFAAQKHCATFVTHMCASTFLWPVCHTNRALGTEFVLCGIYHCYSFEQLSCSHAFPHLVYKKVDYNHLKRQSAFIRI